VLLSEEDPPAFEIERPQGRSRFLLTCDHASRRLPQKLGNLGLSEEELGRHIAWDLGAAALARRLSATLDAFLIAHNYSRLVVDANRPPSAPDFITTRSERTRVEANEGLSALEVRQRREELFEPYHTRICQELDARDARGVRSILVTVHSFTPVFKDNARAWHAGILYGRDSRLAHLLLESLRRDSELVVGDNQPYRVSDESDYTVVVHGERRGIPHVELEVRQDLLATDSGVDIWSERLALALEEAASSFPS
jgi:predicted N-formylglutamate amidohydrolase